MITFNDKPEQANIIRLSGIGQSYDGDSWIIKGLDLIVEDKPGQGQFIIILGMSGCGKSTLLRIHCWTSKTDRRAGLCQ